MVRVQGGDAESSSEGEMAKEEFELLYTESVLS